ncbi:hypothetical protein [Streptomyces sp. NPDC000880]
MTTLGDLFDTADVRLRAAAQTPLAAADPAYRAALAGHLDQFLSHLQDGLGASGDTPAPSPAASDLTFHLGKAAERCKLPSGYSRRRTGPGSAQRATNSPTLLTL